MFFFYVTSCVASRVYFYVYDNKYNMEMVSHSMVPAVGFNEGTFTFSISVDLVMEVVFCGMIE